MSHPSDPQLVDLFLDSLRGKSLREAARLTGISHQLIARYRRGRDAPTGWTYLTDATRGAMLGHLSRMGVVAPQLAEALSEEEVARLRELVARLPSAVGQGRYQTLGLVEEMTRILRGESR